MPVGFCTMRCACMLMGSTCECAKVLCRRHDRLLGAAFTPHISSCCLSFNCCAIQVDFLQHTSDQQQQAASAATAAAAASATSRPVRTATAVVDGQAKQFTVEYTTRFPTKGGYMVDLKLSFDHMDTNHR